MELTSTTQPETARRRPEPSVAPVMMGACGVPAACVVAFIFDHAIVTLVIAVGCAALAAALIAALVVKWFLQNTNFTWSQAAISGAITCFRSFPVNAFIGGAVEVSEGGSADGWLR